MGTKYEGLALQIHFEQGARASAWRRGQLAVAQRPVQAVIDELKARPLSDASFFSNPLELAVAIAASELHECEQLLTALVTSAGAKGAHAELARFPLEGSVSCRVWDARKRQLVERPPESRDVKRDYKLAQRSLRELVRIKAPREAARPAAALACRCGAAVDASATTCPSCRQSFAEPLAVKSAPGDAAAATHAREHLQKLGIAIEGTDYSSFTLVRPRSAKEWIEARDVLTRAGFTLLDAKELSRRVRLLEEAASLPRKYPVGGSSETIGVWVYTLVNSAGADARATLEKLGREHSEALIELSRDLRSSDLGWSAAARVIGAELTSLTGAEAQVAFALPVLLAWPKGRKHAELPVFDQRIAVTALARIAPDLLTPKERATHLRSLESEASMYGSQVGTWLDAVRRLEGVPLAQALHGALKTGTRPDAEKEHPGRFMLAEKVIDWAVDPSALPRLAPLGEAEILRALEELARQGFPPAISKRIQAASKAAPPYGLEPLQAWAFPPLRRTKPTLECPECHAAMKPKAEVDVPQLGPKLGPRRIQIYECDACAAEEPTVEHVHITLGPSGAGRSSLPEAFLDYPDVDEAAREHPSGFVRRKYENWLEESGLPRGAGIQLGGYPHGLYPEDPRLGISCRHTPTLLQFDPPALGMRIPKGRVATSLCLNPGCKRPGVAEPVA
jgi:hypothetical protein